MLDQVQDVDALKIECIAEFMEYVRFLQKGYQRELGIDPGYAIVGYGVISYRNNHFSVIDYGAITTDAKTPFNERLEIIYDELTSIIEKHSPEAMAIEKLFYNSNAKTVIDVSQARGVIIDRKSVV